MAIFIQDEIIDDSEPEREEIRKRERNARKLISPGRAPKLSAAREVIEITDDEQYGENDNLVHVPHPNSKPMSSKNTLTHSLFPASFSPSPSVETTPIRPAPSKGSHARESTTPQFHSLSPHTKDHNAAPSNDIYSDDEPGLKVAHFAYMCPAKSGFSRGGSGFSAVSIEDKPSRKKRLPTHRFSSDFSDADLAKLKKCVSCEVIWTARKTGSQKILHIQSCGKKNAFTEETIRVLIQKEIDTVVAGKGKGKVTHVLPMQRTFFEDIVTDATRKKKGRHLEAVETVQSVAAARSILLDRAHVVLGLPGKHPKSDDELCMVHTQSIGRTGNDGPMAATQAFGQSALGQAYLLSSKPILTWSTELSPEKGECDPDAIPTTQTLSPSRLGGFPRVPQDESPQQKMWDTQILAQSDLINRPHTSEHPPFLLNADPIPGSRNISARDLGLSQSQTLRDDNKLVSSLRQGNNLEDAKSTCTDKNLDNVDSPVNKWHDDEAYLHFEPEMGFGVLHTNTEYQIMSFTNGGTTTSGKQKINSSERSGPTVGDASPTRLTPRRAPKKMKGKQEEQDDEKWEATIKKRLMQDRNMHLRILRYEPIHFDMFLKLASNESTNSGKFKARLRSFLDRQAINFYGADFTGRRR